MKIQHWCPNCEHFFKDFGMNNCAIANWSVQPLDGGPPEVTAWQRMNIDQNSSRIHDDADDCPGFLPFKELAQKVFAASHPNPEPKEKP
jgi:hypothetical protein